MSAGPRIAGVRVGREALEARALELQQQSQGLVFTKAIPVYQALDFGYLGPERGDPLASGFDVAIVHDDVIAEPCTVITNVRCKLAGAEELPKFCDNL